MNLKEALESFFPEMIDPEFGRKTIGDREETDEEYRKRIFEYLETKKDTPATQ